MIEPRRRVPRLRAVAVAVVLAAFGAWLVASGGAKLGSTREFALLIDAHAVLPTGAGTVVAHVFPSIEIVVGVVSVGGLFRKAWQGPLLAILVGVFAALSVYLLLVALAGHPKAECGCFGRFRGMSVTAAAVRNVVCAGVAAGALLLLPSAHPAQA